MCVVLKEKLSFAGIEDRIIALEVELYKIVTQKKSTLTLEGLTSELKEIKAIIVEKHQSMYASEVNSLLNKIHLFGFHFSTLDIRQDSRAHAKVFNDMVDVLIESGSEAFPKNLPQSIRKRSG